MKLSIQEEDEAKMVWHFIIKKIRLGGTTKIVDLDAEEMLHQINMDRLRIQNIWKREEKKKKKPIRLKIRKDGLGKVQAKKPRYVENPKGRSKKKIGEKATGMAKNPTRMSQAKITWNSKKDKK